MPLFVQESTHYTSQSCEPNTIYFINLKGNKIDTQQKNIPTQPTQHNQLLTDDMLVAERETAFLSKPTIYFG